MLLYMLLVMVSTMLAPLHAFSLSDECGLSAADRIVGGRNAALGQYPWLVRIGIQRGNKPISYDCGGTLISERHVLTAAHCVTKLGPGNRAVSLVLGEHDTKTTIDCEQDVCADPVQTRRIVRTVVHPRYNHSAFANDVAVLTMDQRIDFTEWISPICLPLFDGPTVELVTEPATWAEVAGWGLADNMHSVGATVLQTLRLPIVPLAECERTLGRMMHVQTDGGHLCAGGQMGQDSCGGDSGGPLMRAHSVPRLLGPRMFQFGVVSVGVQHCGETRTPAIYSDVRHYLPWIVDQMK